MTSQEIAGVTNEANRIGKPFGVWCKYELGRKSRRFQWSFFRRGAGYIGCATRKEDVIDKMNKFTSAK